QTQPPTPPMPLPSKIVIGFPIALSGAQAESGRSGFRGIMAAVKWVNEVYGGVNLYGKKIPLEVKYYDDESKKENVISYTERLITVDKVHFLLSTYSGSLVFAEATVTEKYKMLLVNWGTSTDKMYTQGFKYVVNIRTHSSMFFLTALEALKSIDPGAKVAVLYKEDEYGTEAGPGTIAKAKELGLNVVYTKSYPANINDFSPYIAELARVGADALIVTTHYVDARLITKQLADAGVNFKLIAMSIGPCLSEYYKTFETLAEGIVCPSPWEIGVKYTPDLAKRMDLEWFGPTIEEFMSLFSSVTGDPKILPDQHSGSAAAAVFLLVKAIEIAQSLDPSAVREAFNKMHLMTLLGEFKIDPATGKQLAHKMVLTQWQGGKLVIVWPSDAAEKKLYYPLPTWDEKRAGKTTTY
ncbi:MAG: amino acid ABC transporter substrate-binding protein, partial [Sulfolobales archaeon]